MKDFRDDPFPRRSLSSLIIAEPGWGKSFLVERLSQEMDMEYREFNITQVGSIDNLMACFDAISSIQTQKPDKPLLIFWDEINTLISAQEVYSYFLGPIWNGVYRRGSQTFQLKPCVWIFAGTRSVNDSRNKGSDFLSRINGPTINITEAIQNSQEDELIKLERLYLSVSLLKNHFPNLLLVSESVLRYLYNVLPTHGVRSIDFVISKFKRISHGKLDEKDLPRFEDIKAWIKNNEVANLMCNVNRESNNYIRVYENPPSNSI